jgi:hypothetical protein
MIAQTGDVLHHQARCPRGLDLLPPSPAPPEGAMHGPGSKSGKLGWWLGGMPPGHRGVGLLLVDGMPHEPQRARSSMIVGQ